MRSLTGYLLSSSYHSDETINMFGVFLTQLQTPVQIINVCINHKHFLATS